MAKSNGKEIILKAPREKKTVTYKGNPIKLSADFSADTVRQKRVAWYIQNAERKKTCNQEYSIQQCYPSEQEK